MFTVHGSLKLALYTLTAERDRLKTALESDSTFLLSCGNTISSSTTTGNIVASLRNSLNQALQQNADLRSRLARIHDTADLSDISSVGPASEMVSFTRHCIQKLEQHDSHNQPPYASCECSSHMQAASRCLFSLKFYQELSWDMLQSQVRHSVPYQHT